MKGGRSVAALAVAALAGQAAGAPPAKQAVTGPVAVYWMSVATSSGLGAGMMGGGAGGRPDPRAMMAMASGGAPAANRTLVLQLGSSRAPTGGDPTAEHDPPDVLGVGPMLPLISPQPQAAPAHEEREEPGPPPQYHQPSGRMLIFWGCGEHTGPGQPYVIDFANIAAGGAKQFMALGHGLGVTPMQPPSPSRDKTYGEWPNAQAQTQVGPDASLQGAHVMRGNYSPEMHFALDASQDFLPPIILTANDKMASGADNLAWNPVTGAKGFFATMIGGQGQDQGGGTQVVMWTSSAAQASGFGLPDYLTNGDIARLVASHALMPGDQTQCVIPAEAVNAAGRGGFFNLVAYGGESNIDYPPRPPAPAPWNIAWQVKLRYRSATSGIVGLDLARMMGRGGGAQPPPDSQPQPDDSQPQQPPPKKRSLFPSIPGLPGSPFP